MVQALFKFVAVWFAALLVAGVIIFFASSGTGALDPAIETSRVANCDGSAAGFGGGGVEECLGQVERQLESIIDDARSNLVIWHVVVGLVVLVIGLLFIVQVVSRSRTAGVPADFRSMKGAWLANLMAIIVVAVIAAVVAHFTEIFGQWAGLLSPAYGWGIPALMAVVWPATYWGGTALGTPTIMKPSVPGA